MPLSSAWAISAEVNRYLLGQLPRGGLEARYAPRTRTVAAQFAHMHDVRVHWMQAMGADPDKRLTAFARGAQPTKRELLSALKASEAVVTQLLDAAEPIGQLRSWKGPPDTFLGYLIAHEAQHRGLAMVALRLSGHALDDKAVFGQWDWGKLRSAR